MAAVDNVSPEHLYEHLSTLRRHYRFVPIDELYQARSWKGMAAVTFDDGYKSVLEHGFPVFQALSIPFTVFLCKIGIDRKVFWRHKVMYILQNGLQRDCENAFRQIRKIPGQSFHAYLKHPSNSSIVVEQELDEFLRARNLTVPPSDGLIEDASRLVNHPLVWYGNHTVNHYVLASLPYREQYKEIADMQQYLGGLRGIQVSQVFSLPFGETHHFNDETLAALGNLGYRCLLVNRRGVNRVPTERRGIRVIERITATDDPIGPQINSSFLRTALFG